VTAARAIAAARAMRAGAADAGAANEAADPVADDVLIARHRAGDPEAFPAIYRGHVAAVHRRLTRILGPIPEREDLLQDVFLALHRALPRFRGEAQLTTLVHRIAINRAYEHLRRQSRRPTRLVDGWFFDDIAGKHSSPELQSAVREDLARVCRCLSQIKPKKRIALLLRLIDGLSFEDIARLVDATPEAVAKRVQLGLRELDALMARAERRAP
jgi:RNA polymerase sigma-70 factor (ECF subfamily)